MDEVYKTEIDRLKLELQILRLQYTKDQDKIEILTEDFKELQQKYSELVEAIKTM